MMKRRTSRAAARAQRKLQKQAGMRAPSGQSNYGRKRQWLRDASVRDANLGRMLAKECGEVYHAERQLFGFDIDGIKPWR